MAVPPDVLSARFDLAALDTHPSSIAIVDPSGSILWVNAAWHAFGAANAADPRTIDRGVNYFAAASGELHSWISEAGARCLATGAPVENDYECSSAETKRIFRMRMLAVPDIGLLISHALRFEAPHEGPAHTADPAHYTSEAGVVVMCSNCRRVRRVDAGTWDWVPAWVASPLDNTSHGICAVCLEYYYPGPGR